MIREKLIKYLKYNRSIGSYYVITDKDADEIIKALEQEPCDDCISRKNLLEQVYIWGGDTETLIEYIKSMPPVTPQPKTGYWIEDEDDMKWTVWCSECHEDNEQRWRDKE